MQIFLGWLWQYWWAGCGRSGGTHRHRCHPDWGWLMQLGWCHAAGASLNSPVHSSLRASTYRCASFFCLPHRNTPHSPSHPPSCLPVSRKNVPLDEGTAQRLTNVCAWCVCDWPCLGRPTQHHNSHDWVFSHCASQQTTAAHTAVGAEWVTVILRWLDWGSRLFFSPCLISLHFNTHYFTSNAGEKTGDFPQFHRPRSKW